jgi:hypothetical protein
MPIDYFYFSLKDFSSILILIDPYDNKNLHSIDFTEITYLCSSKFYKVNYS